jgi:molybdenum cofactor cytidylyltransferase
MSTEGLPLSKVLRIDRGAVVSFVGGGGKTSSMFRLASELRADGCRVVTTTTTHISEEQAKSAPACLRWDSLDLLGEQLDRHGHCLLVGPPDGKGRVMGASSELVASLHGRPDIDVILIEADGSRSRPFKAPGEHEPVVPQTTTILVPIAGLNSIGRALNEDNAHRSELIASIAQQQLGTPVTSTTLARVLSHPRGGAKLLPRGARLIPLLNKADTDTEMGYARETAKQLLADNSVDSVIVSSMVQDPPVREAWTPAAGIVLAAGLSTRFGKTKQTLPWKGSSLTAHAVRTALDSGLNPVIAVLGNDADNVRETLAGMNVQVVFNPEFRSGQSTSIRCGLDALASRIGSAMFILADQPLITAPLIEDLVRVHRRTFAPACAPVFEERRGNPVLFDRSVFGELRRLQGDTGGRALLEKYRDTIVTIPAGNEVLLDVDTPEDYERLRQIAVQES